MKRDVTQIITFEPYKINEEIKYNFYLLPQAFFENEAYKNLSNDAKLLYALLLNRAQRSASKKESVNKNGETFISYPFANEKGEVFIFYPRDDLCETLRVSKNYITKLFLELKRHCLIKEVRQGMRRANIIYLGKVKENSPSSSMTPTGRESRIPQEGNLDSHGKGGSNINLSNPDPSNLYKDKENGHFSGGSEKMNRLQSDITHPRKIYSDVTIETTKLYMQMYQKKFRRNHPYLKPDQLERCQDVLEVNISDYGLEDIAKMIEAFFNSSMDTDYNFNHFCTEGVLQNRIWEVAY
ncbi:MAG: replication initiator protein A [Bacillota bacterium]